MKNHWYENIPWSSERCGNIFFVSSFSSSSFFMIIPSHLQTRNTFLIDYLLLFVDNTLWLLLVSHFLRFMGPNFKIWLRSLTSFLNIVSWKVLCFFDNDGGKAALYEPLFPFFPRFLKGQEFLDSICHESHLLHTSVRRHLWNHMIGGLEFNISSLLFTIVLSTLCCTRAFPS